MINPIRIVIAVYFDELKDMVRYVLFNNLLL